MTAPTATESARVRSVVRQLTQCGRYARDAPEPSQVLAKRGVRLNASLTAEEKSPGLRGFPLERMKGLEPSTFCMASRPDRRDSSTTVDH